MFYAKPKTKAEVLEGVDVGMICKSRFVAKNTIEYKLAGSGDVCTRLHNTTVCIVRPNGQVMLDTGSWQTPTTRDRMNGALPAGWGVSQAKGLMYVHTPAGCFPHVDKAWYFSNGKPKKPTLHRAEPEKYKKDMKLIKAYCTELNKMVETNSLQTSGDPWISVDEETGLYGETYVREWLGERYVFSSIIVNAFIWAGYPASNVGYVAGIQGRAAQVMRRYLKCCLGYAH